MPIKLSKKATLIVISIYFGLFRIDWPIFDLFSINPPTFNQFQYFNCHFYLFRCKDLDLEKLGSDFLIKVQFNYNLVQNFSPS